jgi:hypothetical protein
VYGDWKPSNLKQAYVDVSGWDAVGSYPMFDHLLEGANTLTIDAANEYFDTDDAGNGAPGTQSSNPGACIFALEEDICYLESGETAWGCRNGSTEPNCSDFPGKNWATYFTYDVRCPECPSILDSSGNIELLTEPPENVTVGAFQSDDYVRVWQEFFGSLDSALKYDLDEDKQATVDGPPNVTPEIAAGEYVCSYYVHLDNVGSSSTVEQIGFLEFETDPLGLIISGGNLGTFAGRDLMFAADDQIGYLGTTYPDDDIGWPDDANYLRGFEVDYNPDDAVFNDKRVDFTMWVVNAHDSMRVILPAVWK